MAKDWKCPNCGGINPSSRLTCLGCNTKITNIPDKIPIYDYKFNKANGRRNMLFGAFWCIGGTIVTISSYSSASYGGTYIIAWGAILFGGIQFLRGLIQYLSEPSEIKKQPIVPISTILPINVNPVENRVKKCPFCAEEIKYEAIVCRFCGRDLPIQKDVETTSNNNLEVAKPILSKISYDQNIIEKKPQNTLAIVLISLFVIAIIIVPISIGVFHSIQPTPTLIPYPSITKDYTLIYWLSRIPPTAKIKILPSPTKSYFEEYCVLWSTITIYDVGKTYCVYGNVYNITSDNIAYYISFSNKVNSFYLISYDIYFPDLRNGDCVFATEIIKKLNNSPVMTLLKSDHLYKCP